MTKLTILFENSERLKKFVDKNKPQYSSVTQFVQVAVLEKLKREENVNEKNP